MYSQAEIFFYCLGGLGFRLPGSRAKRVEELGSDTLSSVSRDRILCMRTDMHDPATGP